MSTLTQKVIHVFPELRRGGGPAGYGYNLSKALQEVADAGGVDLVEVLAPTRGVRIEAKPPSRPSIKRRLLKKLPVWLAGPLLAARAAGLIWGTFKHFGFSKDDVEKIQTASVVVFHDLRLARAYFHITPQENQKIYIMPHSPTDFASELVETLRAELGETQLWSFIRSRLMRMEIEIYLKSEGLVAPCRRALDGYFTNMPAARDVLNSLPLYELKSGVANLKTSRSRKEVLTELGVPLNKRIVGFFGRRHPHKGYDLFSRAALLAHERGYKDIVFVVAGTGPLPSPKGLPNFVDLGHVTANLGDFVAAADLVVVPNRVAYFDFLILEAMSLAKPVLTTKIGGSRCIDAPGIFFLEELSAESLLEAALGLLTDLNILQWAGRVNRDIYLERYTLEAFGRRHLEFAKKALELG